MWCLIPDSESADLGARAGMLPPPHFGRFRPEGRVCRSDKGDGRSHFGPHTLRQAAATVAYTLSPINPIPDFILVTRDLDDLIVVPTAIVLTVR